jgi:dolichol-phosphate mannosyltransferase
MRTIVVLPTYNERHNIEIVVEQIFANAPEVHVLIVDDNSPDGTGDIADRLSDHYSGRLFVLHRMHKDGLGRAYVAGFSYALDAGYDFVVQMDADLSHDPAYLPAFLATITSSDVVIGSRYRNGINVVNWGLKRLLLSKAATAYVRLITGLPVTDATGGYKCWRRRALEHVDLSSVFSNGYLFQVETSYKAYRAGIKIDEISIIFYERTNGCSKMNWPIIWEAVWGVLKLRLFPGSWSHRRKRLPRIGTVHVTGQRT